jgi:hypothetical protein
MSAMAGTIPSQSMEQFCADRTDSRFVKDLTSDSSNMMAFQNYGGIGNGGVCWWHSRMQRNALYLTVYEPAEAKPTKEVAAEIIAKIRAGKEIVTIPGYSNFGEFSNDYQTVVQRALEKWQKGDGILRASWFTGLEGSSKVSSTKLKEMMDELYQYVEVEDNIAYEKLQIKGIVAHAWLVTGMKKNPDGYDLQIIDSNFPLQTIIYNYTEGMTNFHHDYYGNFVPYLERKGELENVNLTILKYCNPDKYQLRNRRTH